MRKTARLFYNTGVLAIPTPGVVTAKIACVKIPRPKEAGIAKTCKSCGFCNLKHDGTPSSEKSCKYHNTSESVCQERILSNLQEFFCLLQETNFFRADFCGQKGLSEPFDLLQHTPGHAIRAAAAIDNHVRRRTIGGKALAV